MSIDPRFLTIERWTSQTAPLLLQFGFVPSEADSDTWQRWATSARSLPSFGSLQIPDPRTFDDWQAWAFMFNEKIGLLGL